MKVLILVLFLSSLGYVNAVAATGIQCQGAGAANADCTTAQCRDASAPGNCMTISDTTSQCQTSSTDCLCANADEISNCVTEGLCVAYSAENPSVWKTPASGAACTAIVSGKCRGTNGLPRDVDTKCRGTNGACAYLASTLACVASNGACTAIFITGTTTVVRGSDKKCKAALSATTKCVDTTTGLEVYPSYTQCASAMNGLCSTMSWTGSVGVKSATDKTCTATSFTRCFGSDYIVKSPTKGDGTCIETGKGRCYIITNTSTLAQDSVSYACLRAKDGWEGTPPIGCKDWDATAKNCTDCGFGKTYGATTFKCEDIVSSSSCLSLRFDMIAGLLMGALALNFF